jgi:hypothetical protein
VTASSPVREGASRRISILLRDPRTVMMAICLLAACPRVWLAFKDHSVFWPDEIYQSIEPAHRAAFGYGLISWEFRDGARTWILPGVLAAFMKAASLVTSSGLVLVVLTKLFMVAVSIAGVWAVLRYAELLGGRLAALVAGVFVATYPPLLVFSHRATPEMASAPLLVVTPLLIGLGRPAAAGYAAGLAVALRMQTAPLVAMFLADLVIRRKKDDAARFVSAAATVGMGVGILDWITWGRPFNSVIEYMTFTLRGGSSTFGVYPPSYFLEALWGSTGWLLPLCLTGAALAAKVAPAAVLGLVAFVFAHALIPHKEFRFLSPGMPLFLALAAAGLVRFGERVKATPMVISGLALVVGVGSAIKAFGLRNEDLGHYLGTPYGPERVWHFQEGASLLLGRVGQRPDVCGVLALGVRAGFSGGYSYLHREVPLLYRPQPCDNTKSANYVVAHKARPVPPPYKRVDESGEYSLFRRPGACADFPKDFDFMLEGADDMGLYKAPLRQADLSELDIAAGTSAEAFTSGWSHGEHLECRQTRWAVGRRAEIQFPLEPLEGPYSLSFSAQPYHRALPQTVDIRVNGHGLGKLRMGSGWVGYQALVPPKVLRTGVNTISFGFSNARHAEGADQRELAVLFDRIRLTPVDSSISVDVGTSEGRTFLTSGFSGDERIGDRTAAWSVGLKSRVTFSTDDRAQQQMLRFVAVAFRDLAPLPVSVVVNGAPAGVISVPARWSLISLPLPASALKDGINTIDLEYPRTVRPRDVDPSSQDDRELALMIDRIAIEALPVVTVIDFGTSAGRLHLLGGWSTDESAQGRTSVWSDGPTSEFAFRVPSPKACGLTFSLHAYGPTLPQVVDVLVNGQVVGALRPTTAWAKETVQAPASSLVSGVNVVSLRYGTVARPADTVPESKDARALAIRVDSVELSMP